MEQGAYVYPHIDPTCNLAARSSLNQYEVPSLLWSHLAARFPWAQLTDEEEGLLVHHCLGVYLPYVLVGRVTSHADAVSILRAQFEIRQLALATPCFPQNEGQRLVESV